MDATATPATTRPLQGPAVLRYDGTGRPVYRRGRAPGGLATAAQLRADRLSPAGLAPVAWLYYACIGHKTCPLYDRARARPIRPLTERQRQVLADGRKLANTVPCKRCAKVRVPVCDGRYCDPCGQVVEAERYAAWERRMRDEDEALEQMLVEDRASAAAWAAGALADPALVVLDTETTGLLDGPDPAHTVEITVLDRDETALLDTLVHPMMPIPASATAIHGITDAMVAEAPTFSEILPELTRVLAGRRVVIYNQGFDRGILARDLDRHHRAHNPITDPDAWYYRHPEAERWMETLRTECAMQRYAAWFGDWSDYHGSYTWQPLGGGHRAHGDCVATLAALRRMALSGAQPEAAA
uniref:exonuclease domain-containing protein n=1 Tax=Amycolatopsis sp. CA-096443 TaxID=3239919 RepID=UPI003F4990CA